MLNVVLMKSYVAFAGCTVRQHEAQERNGEKSATEIRQLVYYVFSV